MKPNLIKKLGSGSRMYVDPGSSDDCVTMGWAFFSPAGNGGMRLARCGFGRPVGQVDHVVIELPQIYPRSKADPNDIVRLAFDGGCSLWHLHGVKTVSTFRPSEWKGQTPKEVCERRYLPMLAPEESAIVEDMRKRIKGSIQHNVIDAICLGLWHLTVTRER